MNKRFYTSVMLSVAVTLLAMAAVPSGYYKSLEGKSNKGLKDAIHSLAAPHTKFDYDDLWYYFYETDMKPNSNKQVWDMYSNNQYFFGYQGKTVSGMNKEHSVPNSWWNKIKNEAYSDLHHLVPSDATANNRKSNFPLGEVYNSSFDNGVSKVGTPFSGQGGGATKVFEPDDEYKGDFARMYFYVATVYQDLTWTNTWMFDNYTDSNWKTLQNWAVDLLLKWSREDPVSDKEIARNDAVFIRQNNRNPYIDDPELCEYVWGNRAGQAYDPSHGGTVNPDPDPDPSEVILYTPTQGTILNFGDVELGKSRTLTLYVKGINFTGDVTLRLYRYNYEMFSIPSTTISADAVCSETGYPLEITYTPTALGEHKAKLLLSGGGMVGSVGVDITANCLESVYVDVEGDLNGDGIVDIDDVNVLINIILEKPLTVEIPENQDPDMNGDGVVDVDDVNQIINIVLGKV